MPLWSNDLDDIAESDDGWFGPELPPSHRRTGRDASTTTPSGCRWCGVAKYDHIGLYSSRTDDTGNLVGYHPWTAPPQELIKERMLARRTARQTELETTPR